MERTTVVDRPPEDVVMTGETSGARYVQPKDEIFCFGLRWANREEGRQEELMGLLEDSVSGP